MKVFTDGCKTALSIIAQSQTEILSTSLDLARTNHSEISNKIDTTLDQTRDTLQTLKATEQQIQRSMALQHQASGAQAEILAQLVQVSDAQGQGLGQMLQSLEIARESGIEVSAKSSSVFDQGQAILTISQTTQHAVADSERRLRDDLIEVKEMLAKLRPAIREEQQLADTSLQEAPKTQISVPTSQDSETTLEIAPQSSLFLRRRTRLKETSHTWQRYTRYLSIESVTRQEVVDDDVSHAYRATETRVTVRSTLPFFKRVAKYTTLGTTGDPLFERKLRVACVYTYDSAIYKALTKFDCDETRRLFLSGEASPFMECEQGGSLIDSLLIGVCWRLNDELGDLQIPNAIKLLQFLIDVEGRGAARIGQRSFGSMLVRAFRDKRDLECVNQVIRLIINSASENLLDRYSSDVDLDNAQHPTIKIITQQNIWPVDLDFQGIEEYLSPNPRQRRSITENQRFMLEDPNGDRLSKLLSTATCYDPLGSRPFERGDERPICSLLHIASTTRNMDIKECCKARLRILLSMPDCHKLMESETMEFEKYISAQSEQPTDSYEFRHYIGRYAIRNPCRSLLEEVLHDIGWGDFEIDEFFDKETFYCVPEFLDGQIVFETSRQTLGKLASDLCEGAYTQYSEREIRGLACHLVFIFNRVRSGMDFYTQAHYLEWTIDAARVAYLSRQTPGCWPEEGKITLVPGIDFEIGRDCRREILLGYHFITDHEAKDVCDCEEQHKYRKWVQKLAQSRAKYFPTVWG